MDYPDRHRWRPRTTNGMERLKSRRRERAIRIFSNRESVCISPRWCHVDRNRRKWIPRLKWICPNIGSNGKQKSKKPDQ
nr:transposase [Parageobacillus thermoglucosidasius]